MRDRILEAAARLVGARGLEAATLAEIALAAGVPVGLLRYHFRSREHLIIEAWRATFRGIHVGFEARFAAGEGGVPTALEALDALWGALRERPEVAPFLVQTLAVATRDAAVRDRLADFHAESLARVELGLLRALPTELHRLVLPPDRLARAVRTGLHGLVVELAAARTPAERAAVHQTYEDVRTVLAAIVLEPAPDPAATSSARAH